MTTHMTATVDCKSGGKLKQPPPVPIRVKLKQPPPVQSICAVNDACVGSSLLSSSAVDACINRD